jgi:flagellar motor switch protein FliG
LLKSLPPEDVDAIGNAMTQVTDITRETAMDVLDDFARFAERTSSLQPFGDDQVRKLMTAALGETRAINVIERVLPQTHTRAVRQLNWLSQRKLSRIIEEEHPQVIAVMLSLLGPGQAASVAKELPPEQQVDVLLRMSRLKELNKDALAMLETALDHSISHQASTSPALIDGRQQVVSMLKALPQSDNRALLQAISAADSTLAETIADEMFIFANLADLEPKALQTLVSRIEGNILATALRGAHTSLRDRILACMSARAATTITDEMEQRRTLGPADILAAQKTILQLARQMADGGEISLDVQESEDV